MKRLTEEQRHIRDTEVDWSLAQYVYHASRKDIWEDYSPTSDWLEAGKLIERYNITIQFINSTQWIGSINFYSKEYSASGPTPLLAAMHVLNAAVNDYQNRTPTQKQL